MATKHRKKQLDKIRKKRQQKLKNTLVVMPKDPRANIPSVNVSSWLAAVSRKDPAVWQAIFEYLSFFERHHFLQFGVDAIKKINSFIQCVYSAIAYEDFFPTGDIAARLIQTNHLFQHLVAVSSYGTNDAVLDSCTPMEENLVKLLMLQNPRCEIQIDQEKLFDVNPYAASLWYISYLMGISSPTSLIQKNLFRHLHRMSDKFIVPHNSISGVYFTCTYHNPDSVRKVKSIINKSIKEKIDPPPIVNTPDPKSIAIVTERWHRNHAVYKSAGPLIEQLKDDYKLTLVWTNPPDKMPQNSVTDYFDKVIHCYFTGDGQLVIPEELIENDFQMIYFPDIGMSDESIWMSNLRFAPIQAVGYGHPDTTGDGNEIDYFIGGQVERDADNAYSETRVLIPGLAQEPAWPTAERQNNYKDDGVVRINCVWGPDKYNFSLLSMLAKINERVLKIDCDSKHEFHLFGSPGMNRYAALPSFIKEVRKLLPNAHVHSQWEYYDYMREAEKHDFALNSFPFGCYNVLVESLWMGIPFLTMVGDRFYNRAGMWLNDRIGMSENNFKSLEALIEKAAQLITDPALLKWQRDHLASINLKERLFTLEGDYFKQAVGHIISNHPFTETTLIGEPNDKAE